MLCSLDELINTAPCGFLSFTDDGAIVMINATLLQQLGYKPADHQVQRIDSLLPIASRIFYQTHFFPLLKLHGKAEEIYLSFRSVQGTDIPMLINAARQDHAGTILNTCILIPIHQRIEYEDKILQAKKMAEAAIRAEREANAALEKAQIALEAKQIELLELNAKLDEQVQERTAQLQQSLQFESLLRRITDKVRDSLNEGQILQTAVQELGLGLGVEGCDARLYSLSHTHPSQTKTAQAKTVPPKTARKKTPQHKIVYPPPVSAQTSQHPVAIAYQYYPQPPHSHRCLPDPLPPYPDLNLFLQEGEMIQFCPIPPERGCPSPYPIAVLACSMYDDQGVLGELWLFRPPDETFNTLEIRLVQQVANHCAIALRQSRLYEASQGQVRELERLNQLKDDFLSTISHELRTPMASIKLALQMLEKCLVPLGVLEGEANPLNRYFQILQKESQREITLINDLLAMARMDASTEAISKVPIVLQVLIPRLIEPFRERVHNQKQQLKVYIPQDLPSISTNLSYLERILTELLQNACKYTPEEETITVLIQPTPTNLEIRVSNSGVEIPPPEFDRVFDKFYRIPNNDPWKHGGTGLGLALVKKFTDRLGATIHIESSAGQTTFVLRIPTNSGSSRSRKH